MFHNTKEMKIRHYAVQLLEENNFLPQFLRGNKSKNISEEELKIILLHIVPNLWGKKNHGVGIRLQEKKLPHHPNFFELMNVVEQVYKGVDTPSKKIS